MRRSLLLALWLCAAAGCDGTAKPPDKKHPPGRPEFSGERAFTLLDTLCRIGPRNHGSETKAKAEEWIQGQLKACGAEVSVHAFKHVPAKATGPASFRNIVARWDTGNPRRVLLGTHYDTRSWADRDPDPRKRMYPINGANDGGSGVAVLLALAEVLAAEPPGFGIDMIFFDGEDYGRQGEWDDYFLGSKAWLADHPEYTVEWGIILDMVGDAELKIPREGNSQDKAPQIVDRVWESARTVGAGAFVEERGATIMDDHTAFLKKGLPVILVIDFEYRWFHTDEDDPLKCSAASLGQVGQTVLQSLRSFR